MNDEFAARYFIPPDCRSERPVALSFLSLNIWLVMILFVKLVPMGILQLYESSQNGY